MLHKCSESTHARQKKNKFFSFVLAYSYFCIIKYIDMAHSSLKLVYITPALYMAGGVERVLTLKANYLARTLRI